jgi:PAS domain-containing protein
MVSASRSFDREDRSRSRSRVGSPYSSRPDEPVGIGLSALIVTTGDETVCTRVLHDIPAHLLILQTVYKYVSDSITEILGYQPQDLIGRSAYEIFHPDEIPYLRDIH